MFTLSKFCLPTLTLETASFPFAVLPLATSLLMFMMLCNVVSNDFVILCKADHCHMCKVHSAVWQVCIHSGMS